MPGHRECRNRRLRIWALYLTLLSCSANTFWARQTSVKCSPASSEHVQGLALHNTVLVTAVDLLLWNYFGPSWVASVQSADISYWVIAAMGDDTAAAVEAAGYGDRCIVVPKPANVSGAATASGRWRRRKGTGGRGGRGGRRGRGGGDDDDDDDDEGNSRSRSSGSSGDSGYVWLSSNWKGTTWVKVAAVAGLVELGLNVVHSDIDVTWFRDPLPLLLALTHSPGASSASGSLEGWRQAAGARDLTAVFSTDLLTTLNRATAGEDSGLENSCDPSYNLNTGVYWVSGSETGARLMRSWLAMKDGDYSGDDQQGLNILVRGSAIALAHVPLPASYDLAAVQAAASQQMEQGVPRRHRDAPKLPGVAWLRGGEMRHTYLAAGAPGVTGVDVEGVVVSCLPVSSFSHTYTFATSRLHKVRQHPLYEVHWVWGGKSLESKRQCMRDARVFVDPPPYYHPERIMTFDLEHVEMPPGYNDWPASRTPDMITFALAALSAQLQQAYWALALAMALNRTLVLPQFRCYCAKNWFATTACRITTERDTAFPFPCPLSHVFRARMLTGGELRVADPRPHPRLGAGGVWRVADVREPSFLSNPRTSEALRTAKPSILRVRTALGGGDEGGGLAGSSSSRSLGSSTYGSEIVLDGARTDREVQDLVLTPPYDTVRVLHVPRPATVLSGFADEMMWQQYDQSMLRVTATWCCRSQRDVETHGGVRREKLQPLPPAREQVAAAAAAAAAAEAEGE